MCRILGEGNTERKRKRDCLGKVTPILLEEIYERRHELILSRFIAAPENISTLERMIPRLCHSDTKISEENLRELSEIFNEPIFTGYRTFLDEIVKIKK